MVETLQCSGIDLQTEARESFTLRRLFGARSVPLRDSLAILQHRPSGAFWGLDCHDWHDPFDLPDFFGDRRCRGILKCQYRRDAFPQRRYRLVRPWTYFAGAEPELHRRASELRSMPKQRERLYFRGHPWKERQGVLERLSARSVLSGEFERVEFARYLDELAQHRLALSLPGMGEFCHRDVEILSAGVCLLRPRMRNEFHTPLVADVHYIAVEADIDADGPEVVAERIERCYAEVSKQHDRLRKIGANGAAWYDRNVRFPESLQLTLRLLGLGGKA